MGCKGCGSSISNKADPGAKRVTKRRDKKKSTYANPIVGFAQRIKNQLIAKKPLRTKRMDICEACEFYDKVLVRCNECGCFLKPKVLLKESVCPLKEPKW